MGYVLGRMHLPPLGHPIRGLRACPLQSSMWITHTRQRCPSVYEITGAHDMTIARGVDWPGRGAPMGSLGRLGSERGWGLTNASLAELGFRGFRPTARVAGGASVMGSQRTPSAGKALAKL